MGRRAGAVVDVVLAALALVPIALAVLQATRRSPALPVAFSVLTVPAGALATLLVALPDPRSARPGTDASSTSTGAPGSRSRRRS